ncbi:YciI family protein [Dactylosporangium sp. NPDC051484]|uniref:YciI family protein n=1 Tax=Dactylosporangium sp. NPDC051484 TaxID=3154942 RepID=UPI00344CD6BF
MRYVIMIYSNPATWVHPMFLHQHEPLAPEERAAQLDEFGALMKEIAESGELIESAALADPLTSRIIRFRDGVPAATDGPFADAKEQMAGFFLVECDTPERAEEIATRFPDARHGGVEIRPVMDLSGMEM